MSKKKEQSVESDKKSTSKQSTASDAVTPSKDWAAVKDKKSAKTASPKGDQAKKATQADKEAKVDGAASPEKQEQALSRLKEQLVDYKDIVLRSKAEVENMRLRTQKEVERAHAFGLERFANALLPVVDSLEQAMQSGEERKDDDGIKITYDMFINTLEKFHLLKVGAIAEVFDANVHEAISVQPSETVESNHIVNVVRAGYTLNGRVIRPAMVIVAK